MKFVEHAAIAAMAALIQSETWQPRPLGGKTVTTPPDPIAERAWAYAKALADAHPDEAEPPIEMMRPYGEVKEMVPLETALNAVSHVGSANYDSRIREAEGWLRRDMQVAFVQPKN